jgi:hypothetical protein
MAWRVTEQAYATIPQKSLTKILGRCKYWSRLFKISSRNGMAEQCPIGCGKGRVGMDFRENEGQKMLRQMVRKFAENEVKPVALEYDHKENPKECYPWDLVKKASKLGLRTISMPAEYGGPARYTNIVFAEDEEGLPCKCWNPFFVKI